MDLDVDLEEDGLLEALAVELWQLERDIRDKKRSENKMRDGLRCDLGGGRGGVGEYKVRIGGLLLRLFLRMRSKIS